MTEPDLPDPIPPATGPAFAEPPPGPPERARIEAPAKRRFDGLWLLYPLVFLVLAGAVVYLFYLNPIGASRPEAVDTVTPRIEALTARLAQVEARPEPALPNLAPLEGRVAALEERLASLESRPAPTAPPVDLGPITSRLDAATAKQEAAFGKQEAASAALASRLDAFEGRVSAAEQQAKAADQQAKAAGAQAAAQLTAQVDAKIGAVTETARRLSRLQAAGAALEAGQKLGEIPGAPPALARFATDAPPTDYSLRLSFPAAAEAASRASQPAIMEDKPFLDRLWTRAQQSVSVRQGDRVLLGDPVAGVLAQAKLAVDAGDLPAALTALDGLAGPAKAAMAPWVAQARALIDARAALAQLVARG